MMELLPVWIQNLTAVEQRLLFGLLALAALLVFTYLLRKPLHYWRETRQINRALKRIGARIRRDISLPDGMGGEINIDYLALSTGAILVIGVKRYDGMIFGNAATDEWTQTLNSRSYKFPNPDARLVQQISAVRSIIPKIPVRGLHLFTDSATFPWDKPSNVLQPGDLQHSRARRPGMKDVPAELRTAWEAILRATRR